MQQLKLIYQILKNMGWRYFRYRIWYELRKKTGLLKRDFPTNPEKKQWISLEDWKKSEPHFFFESREKLKIHRNPTEKLKAKFNKNKSGIFTFFSSIDFELGQEYNWITNPENSFNYPLNHWTEIQDFSTESGDIKYVWEKSRFSFIYSIIRYDYHFQQDQADFVFSEIKSWILANPINQGPNWRCSQEISLRVLNWTFALNYYKNSNWLSEELFQEIQHAIYWHMRHVYSNINFSRIAVRNNHAITETLTLYLIGLLMPHFEEADKWKKQGKKWFEEEIAYQIYEDGTFLQFSMNYHRVVIQLLTWALYLSEKNNEEFSEATYKKAQKSLQFLMVCQDEKTGQLPNYGANDGALFFPFNDSDYRDYRPQLNALFYYFKKSNYILEAELKEDTLWYSYGFVSEKIQNIDTNQTTAQRASTDSGLGKFSQDFGSFFRGKFEFNNGGYYIFKEQNSFSFIRCGNHKDRPSQADNLHLDIWVNGENILRDSGSYKYNTDQESMRYFNGTSSHNTIMLGDNDQMKKGPRFIWFDWTQAIKSKTIETNEYFEFTGEISAFKHLKKGIIHKRIVRKYKNKLKWIITDEVNDNLNLPLVQIWNPGKSFLKNYFISSSDKNGNILKENFSDSWYSGYYGLKEKTNQLVFSSHLTKINTIIERNRTNKL